MFKKQIQKLFLSGLLALILFAFIPVFQSKAQPVTPQGPPAECDVAITNSNWTSWDGPSNSELRLTHQKVSSKQEFSAYVKITLTDPQVAACKANGSKSYEVSIYGYNQNGTACVTSSILGTYSQNRSYALTFDEANKAFYARVNKLSHAGLFQGNVNSGIGNSYCMYAYLFKKGATLASQNKGYVTYQNTLDVDYTTATYPPTDTTFPNPSVQLDANLGAVVNNSVSIPGSKLAVQYKADGTKGLRDKYRLVKTDGDMNFGVTNGLDYISLDWAPNSPKIAAGQYLALTERADYTVLIQQDPKFEYTRLYFTDGSKKFDANNACQSSVISEGCGALYSDEWGNQNTTKGLSSKNDPGNLPDAKFNPVLKAEGWNKSKYMAMPLKNDGKPIGQENLYVIPVLWAQPVRGLFSIGGHSAYLMGKNPQKVIIEVYEKQDDIIAACKAENSGNESICTPEYSRYGIGKLSEGVAGSSEQESNNTPGQSLYAFIVRVISNIIVWLQSILYRIFAYIIVPILKALLSVRPYQDIFVNIIYPGWLILRNLANIFFIVALLVVGLRILFQQAASGAARSFIIRLIIMAFLVNFSLVIAQGIVGIADTVQSQFLPRDSRVIEALGAKLMVEPLKSFRAETLNSESGLFDGEKSQLALADTIKPLILLFLSLASFCSFIAIAGFLTVRLVALWVLYMVSPIAYVGYVMDETKSYAKQWWKEFLKYVMITPILAFFLNIAALMATQFSGSNNTLFQFNEDDSLSGDLVIGSLTILTHFIVIGMIFVGMKYAQSSGVYGAEKIVDLAQKIPLGIKDFLTDKAATGLEKLGFDRTARALTAVAKPVDFAKAIKKAQFDEPGAARAKREQERLGNTILTRSAAGDTSKMGSSLKKAREKAKDFEGDDAPYLSEELAKGFNKKDKDHTAGALWKMGQEGHFKEMLEKASELTKNKYSEDAAGLSAMTADLAKRGAITNDNRRDLLNEFDKSASKKKKNAHFAGNVTYNKATKKYETRERKSKPNKDGDDQFNEEGYADPNSWVRTQIKGRTGADGKGALKADLAQADGSTAIDKNGHFTMAQVGVFAEESDRNLGNQKIWDAGEEAKSGKFEKMREAINSEGGKAQMRTNMVRYFQEAQGKDAATAGEMADAKISLIERGLNFTHNRGGNGNGGGEGGGNQQERRQIGITAERVRREQGGTNTEGDDDDDDDEPQARTTTPPPPGGTTTTVNAQTTQRTTNVVSSPTSTTSSSAQAAAQADAQNNSMPLIGVDPFAGNEPLQDLQRGTTYPLSNSGNSGKDKDGKNDKDDKPKPRIGFV